MEESEDEEAAATAESVGGFFVKHGTFMGTENDHAISQSSDIAANDSDYDTDLETEGKFKRQAVCWVLVVIFRFTEGFCINNR